MELQSEYTEAQNGPMCEGQAGVRSAGSLPSYPLPHLSSLRLETRAEKKKVLTARG